MSEMILNNLHPGDIILSQADTFISRGIRFFGKLQTGSARVSHAAMSCGNGLIIESLGEVKINPIEKYFKRKIVVYRVPNITDFDRQEVVKEAMLLAGSNYPVWRIPLFALDSICSFILRRPIYFFTKFGRMKSFQVCSQLIMKCWDRNFDFKLDWTNGSPDFLDDFGKKHLLKIYDSIN